MGSGLAQHRKPWPITRGLEVGTPGKQSSFYHLVSLLLSFRKSKPTYCIECFINITAGHELHRCATLASYCVRKRLSLLFRMRSTLLISEDYFPQENQGKTQRVESICDWYWGTRTARVCYLKVTWSFQFEHPSQLLSSTLRNNWAQRFWPARDFWVWPYSALKIWCWYGAKHLTVIPKRKDSWVPKKAAKENILKTNWPKKKPTWK